MHHSASQEALNPGLSGHGQRHSGHTRDRGKEKAEPGPRCCSRGLCRSPRGLFSPESCDGADLRWLRERSELDRLSSIS